MAKIVFIYIFLLSFLVAEDFLTFEKDNNLSKEQSIFQEQPLKRIKIPTH